MADHAHPTPHTTPGDTPQHATTLNDTFRHSAALLHHAQLLTAQARDMSTHARALAAHARALRAHARTLAAQHPPARGRQPPPDPVAARIAEMETHAHATGRPEFLGLDNGAQLPHWPTDNEQADPE